MLWKFKHSQTQKNVSIDCQYQSARNFFSVRSSDLKVLLKLLNIFAHLDSKIKWGKSDFQKRQIIGKCKHSYKRGESDFQG